MTDRGDFLFTGAATLGWAFGASRKGAQHEKSGLPCEDAFAIWSGTVAARPCIALSVADGHGDPQYDRSGIGAGLAVRAGIDELIAFFQSYAHADSSARIKSGFRADFPRRITRRWRSYVQEELVSRGEDCGTDSGEGTQCTRYGTTLIVVLVTEDEILFGQIGDGALRILQSSGEITAPFHPDPTIIGKATHSLSSRDAHLLWQTGALDRMEGAAVILATDGLPDSFENEDAEYTKFIKSLFDRIQTFGLEEIARQIPTWLDTYSGTGSGDDMTLAIVRINPPGASEDSPATPVEETCPQSDDKVQDADAFWEDDS